MIQTESQPKKKFRINWPIIGLILILAVFLFYSTYLALNLQTGIIPDEPYRYEVSRYFSQTWGIPKDVPVAVEYGDNLSRNPFLGYWIFGRVIQFETWLAPESTEFQQLVWLRIVNGLFAAGTLFLTYLLSKELIKNPWLQLLPVFLLSNTLMFVFLAGGVNYDNPTNLFCVLGIYFLVRVLNGKHFLNNSAGWLISVLAASLIKFSILPLILFMAIIWLIYVIKHKGILKTLKPDRRPQYLLLAVLILLVGGNLILYGGNLLKFHSFTPTCWDTYSDDICQASVFVVRYNKLALPNKLTVLTAFRKGYPEPLRYFFDVWAPEMISRMFGILGHKTYYPIVISYVKIALLWMILLAARYVRKPKFRSVSLVLLVMAYAAVLFVMNYNDELTYGFKQVALQGRYFFPVISLAFVLGGKLLERVDHKIFRYGTIIALILLFLYAGPIRFFWYHDLVFLDWFL